MNSSEWHSLKSKALKWLIIGHSLAIVLLTKHISENKRLLESKRSKMQWNRKSSFFKNHRNCSPPGHWVRRGQSQYSSYNPPLTLNEYLFNVLNRRPFVFTTFFLFGQKQPFDFTMCFIRNTLIANQCQNMINFDVMVFREREEVIGKGGVSWAIFETLGSGN